MNSATSEVERDQARPTHGTARMKAIVQESYGANPEAVVRYAEIDRPTPGEDEVLVRVEAASVDMGTVHLMTGLPYPVRMAGFGLRSPKSSNPGRCLAGTVESTGSNVTAFQPGEPVYGTCSNSFAEYAVVKAGRLAPAPANLTPQQAAAAPISGVTALQAVRKAGVQAGEKVLVIGASGGVGSFAVQIARAYGAQVSGVCRTSKVAMVQELGAEQVFDYTRDDYLDGSIRYDVIIDTGGNSPLSKLRRTLTADGRLVIVGAESTSLWFATLTRTFKALAISPFVKQRLTGLVSSENGGDLTTLAGLIEAGGVMPAIDRTYPLREAGAAIRYVQEGRAQGKVVITVAG